MRSKYRTFLWFAVLMCACGSSTDPEPPIVPQLGHYTYTTGLGNGTHLYSGEMVLTYATADSIAGTWSVIGYDPQILQGRFDGGYYFAYANVNDSPTTAYTVTEFATTASATRCKMTAAQISNNFPPPLITGIKCSLKYVGP
jgi:hypothetical protein